MRLLLRLSLRVLATCLLAAPALARPAPPDPTPAQLCQSAIAAAERAQHTPAKLLAAIAMVESGRPDPHSGAVRAWPWTINAEGSGQFFETKPDAIQAVEALQARGVRSIDVGCMQINLMHHPNAFASLDEAFEPQTNAAYAARFLTALYRSFGDWPTATAAYHSQTEALGTEYARKVMAVWGHPYAPVLAHPIAVIDVAAALAQSNPQYRAFAPQAMLFGAFSDPTLLRAGLRGYGGLSLSVTPDFPPKAPLKKAALRKPR